MLQTIREHTSGWIAWTLVVLIVFAMAFFGIEHYFQTTIPTYAAKIDAPPDWWRAAPQDGVAGRIAKATVWETHEIDESAFRERFDQYRQQVRSQAGDSYDAEQVESIDTKRAVLDAMVDEEILRIVAERDGVAVDAQQVRDAILEIDGLTRDGQFIGDDAYRIWLQSRGLTAASLESLVARQILTGTMPDAVRASGLVGDAELGRLLKLQQETRDLRYLEVPLPIAAPAIPDDAALAAWHEANGERYSTPETVVVSYIDLNAADLPASAEPTDDELRERYEQERARFGTEEERVASHILVSVAPGADEAAVEAARVEAQGVAERARAEGADFAALAAAESDDLGSKELGGELGPIPRDVFPKPFEDAVFALAEGGVSDPVRTDEGWHVIKLTGLVAGDVQPFEAVREQLLAESGEAERERLFSEKQGELVDAILREPNSLPAVAQALGLEVRTSGAFTRDAGEGVAILPAVRDAAFTRTQRDDRVVSDPIDVGPAHVVVLQVTEHSPAAVRPLAEVRDDVLADLQVDTLAKAMRAQADALLERARQGESLAALASEVGGVVQDAARVSRQAGLPDTAIVTEGFRLQPLVAGQPADVGLAALGGPRFALVAAAAVNEGDLADLTPEIRGQLRSQLAQMRGEMERQALVQALRSQFTVTVAEERL